MLPICHAESDYDRFYNQIFPKETSYFITTIWHLYLHFVTCFFYLEGNFFHNKPKQVLINKLVTTLQLPEENDSEVLDVFSGPNSDNMI